MTRGGTQSREPLPRAPEPSPAAFTLSPRRPGGEGSPRTAGPAADPGEAAEPVCSGASHPTPGSRPGQALPLALESDSQPADDRDRAREIPAPEILFLDPGVSDIETILGHLRPEIEAILLDPVRPAARQIAAPSPAVTISPQCTSSPTAPRAASISPPATGRPRHWRTKPKISPRLARRSALRRNVNLWSCQTAAGPAGAAFIAGLARASGADIAAATGLVGATALGRKWELMATACPPLTDAGMAGYAGVLATTLTSTGRGQRFSIFGSWPLGTGAGTYFVVLNNSGQSEVLGKFIVPTNVTGTFVVSADLPAGSYTLGSNNVGPGTITVYNGKRNPGGPPEGAWSLGDFDPAITATLNYSRNTASNLSGAI